MTTVAVVRGMSKADAEMQTTSGLEARVVAPLLAGIVIAQQPFDADCVVLRFLENRLNEALAADAFACSVSAVCL